MRIGTYIVIFALCIASAVTNALAADPAPVEAYGSLPLLEAARLSPDGMKVAGITPVSGRSAIIIYTLDGKTKPVLISTGDFIPEWIRWKTDRRLIAAVRITAPAPVLGHIMGATRMVALDVDGGNIKNLVHMKSDQRWVSQLQDRLVDMLPNDSDHILIEVDRHEPTIPDVVKVDVNTGEARDVVIGKLSISGWMSDTTGMVRAGVAIRGTSEVLYVRDSADQDWRAVDRADHNFGIPLRPISFSDDSNVLYAETASSGGTWGVYEFNISKGTIGRQIIGDPNHDAELEDHDGRLVGYSTAAERVWGRKMVYLDPAWEHDIETIDHAVPETFNLIVDRTSDGKRVLVHSQGPKEPSVYYILDRYGPKTTLNLLGHAYPKIEEDQVAPVRPITYKARDGLLIHGYLTLPVGYSHGPIPFVVLPHGGPSAHDTGKFDFLAQFIASRGYGVLQPNFRGSTGYGPAFEQAGLQQWGLAMQDDVTDGTKWLIEKNFADPKKICIAGASYGGYAALMGTVKEPDLYRCAVSFAGISDLNRLMSDMRYMKYRDLNLPRVRNGKADETSPDEHADQVRIPILLAHGRKDYTVAVEQTEEMESALRHAGKPVQAIYYDDDDHYLSHEANRIAFLKTLERFLRDNLGPGATN